MDCLKNQFCKGTILDGRFETVAPLNHGSFGMVFMANDLKTNEVVAIKCLTKKTVVSDADSTESYEDHTEELNCHIRLGIHPNIVNLIHSFETEAHIFIVLEFCSRGDLYEAIRTGTGPLQTEHVRQFMLQLVEAVAYIHLNGMYHRDIKPENIFLAQSGDMKLGDFGLATTQKWTYEVTVGSDRYMAPEQFDSAGAGYSPEKADIWAIGICLLNILFSRNPFTAPTESDPLFLDFSRDMQSLFDVFPSMSQDTFEVLSQCLSLDPRKRSLDGVREALERVVSFTTSDEMYDDFCMAERRGIASANREPLRTPSIQTPQAELESFNWNKALLSPSRVNLLDYASDEESYSEELFPKLEDNGDWFSDGQQSPSLKSVMESSFGNSTECLPIHPSKTKCPPKATISPQSNSLPASFGSMWKNNNDTISKSWSDLWEEDEEEVENQIKVRQMQNSRTWSRESKPECELKHFEVSKKYSDRLHGDSVHREKSFDINGDMICDGLFFDGNIQDSRNSKINSFNSPPPKKQPIDKWSALGERRRAFTGPSVPDKELGFLHRDAEVREDSRPMPAHSFVRYQKGYLHKDSGFKFKGKGCPWSRERVCVNSMGRVKRQMNPADFGLVGGSKQPYM